MENKPTYAILHHTADTSKHRQLLKVNEWHKYKQFPESSLGYFVGYHFFIERSGVVIKTRHDHEEGAHTRGRNLDSLGIGLAGHFDFEVPTEAQLNALQLLLDNLAIKYGVTDFPILYHHKFADTHCPGNYFLGKEWAIFILKNKLSKLQLILIWLKTWLNISTK